MSGYTKFREFLRNEGCEAAFDRAFYQYNDCTAFDESLWEAGNAECFIGHAFEWSATPEGREFWLTIDRKWIKLIK